MSSDEAGANRAARLAVRQSPETATSSAVPPSGQPLSAGTRQWMESRLLHDFSRVRIHHDDEAQSAAARAGALAYTNANDIVFGTGQYAPETREGRGLLTHELAHVIQQHGRARVTQFQKPLAAGGEPLVKEVHGVKIIGTGTTAAAVNACAALVSKLVAENKYAQAQMKKEKVTLVIIPHSKKMTELPQFEGLKGTKTFDGRLWDDVRGSGGMKAPDGSWAIGVPEENLMVMKGVKDQYPAGYSVGLHEFAHTVKLKGLTGDQSKKVTQLYAEHKKAGGPWTETYGSSDENEYFAQSTNAYFGLNKGMGENGRAWLLENDPKMCAFLDALYGKKYDLKGNEISAPKSLRD